VCQAFPTLRSWTSGFGSAKKLPKAKPARSSPACITPAIARFMPWEPPSWNDYVTRCEKREQAPEPNKFSFVIRRLDNRECLGMASLEDADSVSPELGLWLKESAHGQGFGREVVAALVAWGHATLGIRTPATRSSISPISREGSTVMFELRRDDLTLNESIPPQTIQIAWKNSVERGCFVSYKHPIYWAQSYSAW